MARARDGGKRPLGRGAPRYCVHRLLCREMQHGERGLFIAVDPKALLDRVVGAVPRSTRSRERVREPARRTGQGQQTGDSEKDPGESYELAVAQSSASD
jgi:hypothetical protein